LALETGARHACRNVLVRDRHVHPTAPLYFTLVAALSLALLLGILARQLRLPPLVGYLLAGVAVGPHTPGIFADPDLTAALAEIGVALLLFGVGLHFSLADLLAARRVAVPGALGQIAAGTVLGALAGAGALGLDPAPALVVGLALAIASTAVATRTLTDRGRLSGEAGRIALGWLVVQDLVVVVALVLLPAVAGAEEGRSLVLDLARSLLALTGFIVAMAVVGRRLLPWALARAARTGSRELFTLAVVVAALGVAYGAAELFGVSVALGAFFAGVVLGESHLSHQAAARALPLEQVFAVLFFVSVGMLFDPLAVIEAPFAAVAVVLAALLGTGGATLAMLALLRVEPRTAAIVAGALAQIGEFSFVLTELAIGRGLLPAEARGPVLVAAFVTVVANPVIGLLTERLGERAARSRRLRHWFGGTRARRRLPDRLAAGLADHAIIVGHGRVGSVVAAALRRHHLPYVVIEADHRQAERLRAQGTLTVWGDATDPEVLAGARPETARLLVVALPVAFLAQRVVELACAANPGIDIAVRAHADEEVALLSTLDGVGLVVMGEREVALGASDYVLQRFGVDAASAQATMDALRAGMPGAQRPRAAAPLDPPLPASP